MHAQQAEPDALFVPKGLAYSLIRPETLESLYYLHYFSGNGTYLSMGQFIWHHMKKNSFLPGAGFCSIADVTNAVSNPPPGYQPGQGGSGQGHGAHGQDPLQARAQGEKICPMHTFVLSETLKYLYLLFKTDNVIDLDEYVFNTEAHPLRRFGKGARAELGAWVGGSGPGTGGAAPTR